MATVEELKSDALSKFLQQYVSLFSVENIVPTFVDGQITRVDEYVKGQIVSSVSLVYDNQGALISYTETAGSQSATFNINYENGDFKSITKV